MSQDNPNRYVEYFDALRHACKGYAESETHAVLSDRLGQIEAQIASANLDATAAEEELRLARSAAALPAVEEPADLTRPQTSRAQASPQQASALKTYAKPNPGTPPVTRPAGMPRSLSGRNPLWIAVGAFLLVYLGVLTLFLREGSPSVEISGVPPGSLPVEARLSGLDFLHDTVLVTLTPDMTSSLVADKSRLIADIAVEIDTGSSVLTHVFKAGTSPVPWSTMLPLEYGDTLDYPFDRHGGDFHIRVGRPGAPGAVPDLEMQRITHGFKLGVKGEASADAALNVEYQISRSPGVIFLTLMATISLALVVGSAINVAWRVNMRGRKVEFSMMVWMAAMLFVIPAVRNGLPSAPPPGALIDIGLFFWLHLLAVGALLSVVWNWSREG